MGFLSFYFSCYNIWHMDNVLATLLGSVAKAKILRQFLSNSDIEYTQEELRKAAKLRAEVVKKELKPLLKIGLIKEKNCKREVIKKIRGKKQIKKQMEKCFIVVGDFKYLSTLKHLVFNIDPATDQEVLKILRRTGSVKLLLLAGVFVNDQDARVDIFLVADKVKEKSLNKAVADIEAHVGKELAYVHLTADEFEYRLSMYDKLVRDVLDSPYRIVFDKFKGDWRGVKMAK